jgi:hypothetical protein
VAAGFHTSRERMWLAGGDCARRGKGMRKRKRKRIRRV